MVTHDPKIAAQANRVVEIKDGYIVSDTSKSTEIAPSKIESVKERISWSFYKDQFLESFRMSATNGAKVRTIGTKRAMMMVLPPYFS